MSTLTAEEREKDEEGWMEGRMYSYVDMPLFYFRYNL